MMHIKHMFCQRWRFCAAFAVIALVAAIPPAPVRADDGGDDGGPKAAPRSVVKIGGVSVVLIAANDRIYAFIDRLSDNAPASDARLTVSRAAAAASGATTAKLDMKRATGGLFVAPFDRTGHLRDTFTVSVRSAAGTGQETAEMVYDDAPKPAQIPTSGLEAIIALVAGALGAALALAIVWFRQSRRRPGETIGKPRAA
jgi:hypothetical protein